MHKIVGQNSPCSGEVEGIHKAEGSGTGSTTRSQVTHKVAPELCSLVYATKENLLVLVLESEVEGLGGEISDDVGEVTTPVAKKSLFFGDSVEAIYHACKRIQVWLLTYP